MRRPLPSGMFVVCVFVGEGRTEMNVRDSRTTDELLSSLGRGERSSGGEFTTGTSKDCTEAEYDAPVLGLERRTNSRGESEMKRAMGLCSFLVLVVGLMAAMVGAQGQPQDKTKRPSPPASADCTLASGGTIHVDYSVPSMKGRKIFGELVPYGEVWRAGANEATTFVISKDVTVGGKMVPAGSYTLFAIPDKDKWTLVISKKTGEWGVPYPGAG